MKKKGEITTQQIVLLIILIASFAIILFFIVRLNLGKTSAKEICHNSVVTRGSVVLPKEATPLNCKTTYLCITEDGSCEKVTNAEIKKVKTKDDTYKILADEMADCWWIFGEGKINYIGTEFFSNLYCSICSQIAFDDSMTKIFDDGQIDQKNLYEYLSNTKIPDEDTTYLNYISGIQDVQSIEDSLTSGTAEFEKINFEKQYYVIMGIFSDVGSQEWAIAGGILGGLVAGPAGLIAGAIIGGTGGPVIGTTVKGESGQDYLSPAIIEANSADFDKLKCGSIKTLA